MKLSTFIILWFIALSAVAGHHPAIEYIKTEDAPASTGPYSQGTILDLSKGKLVFVSGQSEDDPKTGKLHNENIAAATNQTLDNIEAILKAAGTDLSHVVKMDVYLKDMNDWPAMNKEYIKRYPNGTYPARVAVQALNGYLIEISCIAFVPDNKRK
jgi:2-iminobutanoate/2-iminopropanoate deaminase